MPIIVVTMGDEILGHKDLFSFHKKDIVADSSLAPHAKSFADVVLNKKTMVMPLPSISSIPQQKGTFVSVKVNPTTVEERLNLCKFSLIGHVILSKGLWGVPLKIDQATLNGDFGNFARGLVDIDLKNPLLDSIEVESGDEYQFVYLSYERLPDFCSSCSSIGHVPSNCYHNKPKEDKEKITKKSEGSAPKQQVYVAKPITNQVVSKDVQKSLNVPVEKIFTSLASDLEKDNTLVHFGNIEDEVEIFDSLEKNKAHYDKDDELVTIDENINTKEDVALNHDSEYISNMDKVVNTEVHEEYIEAPTAEVGISDPKGSSSFAESKSDHSLDTSDLSLTKVFTSKDEENEALCTLDNYLSQEETYLREQSRIKWLKEGDKNSTFFHNMVKRCRAKKVLSHMKIGEDIAEDITLISSHIQSFYKDLFTEPQVSVINYSGVQDIIPNLVSSSDNLELCRILNEEEIRLTVFDMDASSATSPDGF
ncbi:Zinc knuckle CX2CX4HX4C [Parasponia andersonii]|uniref:Zinc knuckle CX2CX4HX4C n=1 Tax=Parasponia andersonii TaxID=3476 RepID=A0A2P5ALH4_PARAD|nr:Zinc knuckle CX2CX4HX4C [Parasponia andersonii]